MAGKGSGWKNESRRHSLARKGVKTAKGTLQSRRDWGEPPENYMTKEQYEQLIQESEDKAWEDIENAGLIFDDWHIGSDYLGDYIIIYTVGQSGKKYSLDGLVRSIIDDNKGNWVDHDKAMEDIENRAMVIDDYSSGEDCYGKYIIAKMQGDNKKYSVDLKIRSIYEE